MSVPPSRIYRARWMCPEQPIQELMRFLSVCPGCGRKQPQQGFSRAALLRLLDDDLEIQAYCVTCHSFWPISEQERLLIINEVGG